MAASVIDEEGVNGGVPGVERHVELPRTQQLGGAAGICQQAGAEDGLRVEGYVIDWEAAYRFVQTQRAEWWQACFINASSGLMRRARRRSPTRPV